MFVLVVVVLLVCVWVLVEIDFWVAELVVVIVWLMMTEDVVFIVIIETKEG